MKIRREFPVYEKEKLWIFLAPIDDRCCCWLAKKVLPLSTTKDRRNAKLKRQVLRVLHDTAV